MAWTAALDAVIGNPTKASDYDKLVANAEFLQTKADVDHDFDVATGTGYHNPEAIGLDGVVGGARFTTLQAGDDELDAADYTMWVKQATYAAGLTVSTNDAYVFVEPGTIIQAAIVLSGNNVTLELGAGCDIQALVTLSGTGCHLICHNGCDLDGIVLSGAQCLVDGGGWETLVDGGVARHAISVTASLVTIQNISAKTTAGGGTGFDAINAENTTATYLTVRGVYIPGSDRIGIISESNDMIVESCVIRACDANSIQVGSGSGGARSVIRGNNTDGAGSNELSIQGAGDNFNVTGNQFGGAIAIAAGGDSGCMVGNTHDDAITDSGTGNTVASNEQY